MLETATPTHRVHPKQVLDDVPQDVVFIAEFVEFLQVFFGFQGSLKHTGHDLFFGGVKGIFGINCALDFGFLHCSRGPQF